MIRFRYQSFQCFVMMYRTRIVESSDFKEKICIVGGKCNSTNRFIFTSCRYFVLITSWRCSRSYNELRDDIILTFLNFEIYNH